MNKKQVCITLGIMCLLLTTAIIIQLNTIKTANATVGQSSSDNELRDEVLRWKDRYDQAYKELEESEQTLKEQRELASSNDLVSIEKEEELSIANIINGLTEVKGKGVVLTVADNNNVTSDTIGALENISDYMVHAEDLWMLVNELKNAGVEAISINDERIIASTAITCEGNVILINGNRVSSPFIINAIGSPEAIIGALDRPGGFIEVLQDAGVIVELERKEDVTIPKYNGIIDMKYIRNVD